MKPVSDTRSRFRVWCLAIRPRTLAAAVGPVLVVNNLRDMDTDRETGQRTLAVMIGPRYTRIEYTLLVLLAYAFPLGMLAADAAPPAILRPFLSLPRGGLCIRKIYQENGRALNARLGTTAMLALGFSVLLSIGIAVS